MSSLTTDDILLRAHEGVAGADDRVCTGIKRSKEKQAGQAI